MKSEIPSFKAFINESIEPALMRQLEKVFQRDGTVWTKSEIYLLDKALNDKIKQMGLKMSGDLEWYFGTGRDGDLVLYSDGDESSPVKQASIEYEKKGDSISFKFDGHQFTDFESCLAAVIKDVDGQVGL